MRHAGFPDCIRDSAARQRPIILCDRNTFPESPFIASLNNEKFYLSGNILVCCHIFPYRNLQSFKGGRMDILSQMGDSMKLLQQCLLFADIPATIPMTGEIFRVRPCPAVQ